MYKEKLFTLIYCDKEQMYLIVSKRNINVIKAAFSWFIDALLYARDNHKHVEIPIYYRKALLNSRQSEL